MTIQKSPLISPIKSRWVAHDLHAQCKVRLAMFGRAAGGYALVSTFGLVACVGMLAWIYFLCWACLRAVQWTLG
jgi:hypothetical protein